MLRLLLLAVFLIGKMDGVPIEHPVSTTIPEAQQAFNVGLTYIFAFNHDLAFREFEKASKIDPHLAMAYWGMALALGQNINTDVTQENELRAYNYIQQALKLSSPSEVERRYIDALAVRYTNDKRADLTALRLPYKEAMEKLAQSYPDDLDAATLYAESILDLNPWKWWTLEGKPVAGTPEAIDVLESVLERNPFHIGANHYYVHALEESPHPERGLLSADRLTTLLPESGHLLHMPCHIYLLTGFYEKAVQTNTKAVAADREYIRKYGVGGNYPTHYLSHNLYVLARTYMLMGDYPNALKTANELTDFLRLFFANNPHLARFAYVPLEIMLYFDKWEEILQYQPLSSAPITQAFWHYSRGRALAAKGDLVGAKYEKNLLHDATLRVAPEEEIANNPASKVLELATILLDAAIGKADNDPTSAQDVLKKGIALQDTFFYDEPPAWSTPIRQVLGEAYLKENRFKEAEPLFREILQKYQRNPRALSGLFQSLQGQGKDWDAFWIGRGLNNFAPKKCL